jgi:hypothetical protein
MAPQDSPIWFKTFMNDDARHPNDLGHKFMADIAIWSIQQVRRLGLLGPAAARLRCWSGPTQQAAAGACC